MVWAVWHPLTPPAPAALWYAPRRRGARREPVGRSAGGEDGGPASRSPGSFPPPWPSTSPCTLATGTRTSLPTSLTWPASTPSSSSTYRPPSPAGWGRARRREGRAGPGRVLGLWSGSRGPCPSRGVARERALAPVTAACAFSAWISRTLRRWELWRVPSWRRILGLRLTSPWKGWFLPFPWGWTTSTGWRISSATRMLTSKSLGEALT